MVILIRRQLRRSKNDRYVDDLASGGSCEQVARLRGNDKGDDFSTDGTLSQILSYSSLKLKVIVTSGEENPKKMEKLGGAVLGHGWDPQSDTISIISPDIDIISSQTFTNSAVLTPRKILAIINKPHDLIGLVTPIAVQGQVAYRNLFALPSPPGWDDSIPLETQNEWFVIFKLLEGLSDVKFPRSTRPPNAVGKHDVIAFFDGSDHAFAAVVYYRWVLSDGSIEIRLAASKASYSTLPYDNPEVGI